MSAKKNLDLSGYKKQDTEKAQDRHNKYTSYIKNELISQPKIDKKAWKRINMAFTDENYALIQHESERLGISFFSFVDAVIHIVPEQDIRSYLESQPIRRTKENVARNKGKPAKRINLKFSDEAHKIITVGANQYNQTLTQYVNTVMELYAQEQRD